jgi:hypothetical protein
LVSLIHAGENSLIETIRAWTAGHDERRLPRRMKCEAYGFRGAEQVTLDGSFTLANPRLGRHGWQEFLFKILQE